jgi:hypothetical protein
MPACEDKDYLSNEEKQYKDKERACRRTVLASEALREGRVRGDVEKDGSGGHDVRGAGWLSI